MNKFFQTLAITALVAHTAIGARRSSSSRDSSSSRSSTSRSSTSRRTSSSTTDTASDQYASFEAALDRWGSPSYEAHEVTASDGAITTVFHLTGNLSTFKDEADGQSILLNHGSFMDAVSWFYPEGQGLELEEGDKPLPIRLLDLGYDVWLTNMRGTPYSRKHEYLDSNDPDSGYWNFSWDKKGMLDVPATIDRIKFVSDVDKVVYMGASQGTTVMFYALTQTTEEEYFAENMSAFIALAPCMISPQAPYDYETFINTEWQALETYPNLLGEGYTDEGYCEESNNGMFCSFLPYLADAPGISSCDTRSMF